jgi:hypothetical protein
VVGFSKVPDALNLHWCGRALICRPLSMWDPLHRRWRCHHPPQNQQHTWGGHCLLQGDSKHGPQRRWQARH